MQNKSVDYRGPPSTDDETNEGGQEAERALLVVEQKLSNTLSSQAIINELIQEASDHNNLANLFCGNSIEFEISIECSGWAAFM